MSQSSFLSILYLLSCIGEKSLTKYLLYVSSVKLPFVLLFIIWITQPSVYLSLPPTRQDLTQGQKPEGQLK